MRPRKTCPECGHKFRGPGWDGVDAHWRAKHEAIMPYEQAFPLIKSGKYICRRADHAISAPAPDAAQKSAPATPAEPPCAAPAMAAKAKDLESLRDAVVDAAGVSTGLWLSYIFVLLYFLIAVSGVTHRDLLFESPVKLPFLSVDLPLIGFFVLGPLLFIIVHTYVLLHLALLAGKVGDFHTQLQSQIGDADVRARLRRQLPSNIFVQFLAGPREVRVGVFGYLLRLIAQISLVAGPIALLVFFQLQFLPYHDWRITWWQRFAVVADLVLLWNLWPSIARGNTTRLAWRDLRRGRVAVAALASLTLVLLVFSVATFPGEWLESDLPTLRFIPITDKNGSRTVSLHELLVVGSVDFSARSPTSLWSNRIVLPGFDVIDHSKFDTEGKIAALPATASLRGRHLEWAELTGAILRKADFTGASLQGAVLTGAQLQGAVLDGAQLQGAMLFLAQLQGASLKGAGLQGASLDSAHLQGASLDGANLQGASMNSVQLQGGSLDAAQLQSASMNSAQLQGASLNRANLQGASLDSANLQSASLSLAFLWMADARRATGNRVQAAYFSTTPCLSQDQASACTIEEVQQLITQIVPQDIRDTVLMRITQEFESKKMLVSEMAKAWAVFGSASPESDAYERGLAEQLRATGCAADGAPYVIPGLLHRLETFTVDTALTPFFPFFLDQKICAGAYGLSEADKARLTSMRYRVSPLAPESNGEL
jgi:uncharacterized protein YjbI with pentapeptide repeats